MKYLLSKTENGWGKFLHKQGCNTNASEKVVSTTESHEHVKECSRTVETELHCASTEVALHSCRHDVEGPEEKGEKSKEARKRVREEFKNTAREINGRKFYDHATGEYVRVESFVSEKKISLKRPRITIFRSGTDENCDSYDRKEVYILGRNKIIRKEYDSEAKGKHKWKSADKKGGFKYNTEKNMHKVRETKDRKPGNKDTILKTKDKSNEYWNKTGKEKTKFKDSEKTQSILNKLQEMSGVIYKECPTNCFE